MGFWNTAAVMDISYDRYPRPPRYFCQVYKCGIGVQAFDLFDRLDTKNAKKGRIRKNSLLNSVFSGNLTIETDPRPRPEPLDRVECWRPRTSRYGSPNQGGP